MDRRSLLSRSALAASRRELAQPRLRMSLRWDTPTRMYLTRIMKATSPRFLMPIIKRAVELIYSVDVLARLGIYLISEPSPAFIPLLRPLFTPISLPETLIVVLLDWARPWEWVRQLKTWVRLLRGIFTSLDDDCRRTLDDVTQAWESRRSTYSESGGGGGAASGSGSTNIGDIVIPLGPGEFDEPIGLPLCVVCQNVRPAGEVRVGEWNGGNWRNH